MIASVLPIAVPATFSQSLPRVTADQYHFDPQSLYTSTESPWAISES